MKFLFFVTKKYVSKSKKIKIKINELFKNQNNKSKNYYKKNKYKKINYLCFCLSYFEVGVGSSFLVALRALRECLLPLLLPLSQRLFYASFESCSIYIILNNGWLNREWERMTSKIDINWPVCNDNTSSANLSLVQCILNHFLWFVV